MVDGGKLVITTEMNTKSFDKQIEKVQSDLKELNKRYDETKNIKDKTFTGKEDDLKKYQIEIEKTTNKLAQLQKQQQKVSLSKVKNIEFNPLKSGSYSLQTGQLGKSMKGFNPDDLKYVATDINDFKKGVEDVGTTGEKSAKKSSKGFDSFGKTIKKVGLRILGLSSIYAAVSRASSAYLSQDTELAQKLQSVWSGLGSFLAPVLELMADVMAKAVGYLNVFIEALTGTDYIAKANAKAIDKQAKAQAGLNKEMQNYDYDFDVIRTQSDMSSGGGGGVDTGSVGFQMPELNEKIVQKLRDLAKWLKENKDLIKDIGIVLGITFGALVIGSALANIAKLIGVGGAGVASGLAGLVWLLGIIAVVWLGKIIIDGLKDAVEQAGKLNEELDDNIAKASGNADTTRNLSIQYRNLALSEQEAGKKTQMATNYYNQQSQTLTEHIKRLEKDKNIIGAVTGANNKLHSEQLVLLNSLKSVTTQYYSLYIHGKLNEEQTQQLSEALQKQREVTKLLGRDTETVDRMIEAVAKKDHTIKVNTSVEDNVSYCIDNIIQRNNNKEIRLQANFYDPKTGQSSYMSPYYSTWNGYAEGGIVTQPTRALIGEAGYPEAVVPMTQGYLSTLAEAIGQYSNSSGASTVNVYLDGRLIQREVNNRQQQVNFIRNM